jgi:uncharacterized protein YecE (DUF72 family)
LAGSRWFDHYQRRFPALELNGTFYRFPKSETVAKWRSAARVGFVFAVKAWKFFTHMKRLQDCESKLLEFAGRARELGPALGPILLQLPAAMKIDVPRLERFVATLPKDLRWVVEFRDASWWTDEVRALLAGAGVATCRVSAPGLEGPCGWLTAPFAYFRLHGARRWYYGRYKDAELRAIAEEIREAGRETFVFFDNTADVSAVPDARKLMRILRDEGLDAVESPAWSGLREALSGGRREEASFEEDRSETETTAAARKPAAKRAKGAKGAARKKAAVKARGSRSSAGVDAVPRKSGLKASKQRRGGPPKPAARATRTAST